jgi:hypothetical protein
MKIDIEEGFSLFFKNCVLSFLFFVFVNHLD